MIVVFGSINVDLVFRVPHLPREGETVGGGSFSIVPGGKGANQAVAAARDGARVALFGAVGDDGFAAIGLAELGRAGVDTGAVERVPGATGVAGIAVDGHGANQIVVAPGANARARQADVPDRLLDPGSTLVCQMELPPAETAALVRRARVRGARIVLNLAPAGPFPRDALAMLDVLVMNELEAAALARQFGRAGGADAIAAHLPGVAVVETHGGEGARAVRDSERWTVPALDVTVVDTTAAGDAFVGVLAASLDRTLPFERALRRAAAAGSLACTKAGAQTSLPDAAAIDAALGA